ncbi:MAG: hypothetical protein ABMB14_06345 [Myxococcota bacterium]
MLWWLPTALAEPGPTGVLAPLASGGSVSFALMETTFAGSAAPSLERRLAVDAAVEDALKRHVSAFERCRGLDGEWERIDLSMSVSDAGIGVTPVPPPPDPPAAGGDRGVADHAGAPSPAAACAHAVVQQLALPVQPDGPTTTSLRVFLHFGG